ncbi:MAG: copper oxidase [FCB group bacterium]|jgi:FtsP/CotA-like multicopper oxidase with cupredoxin domain|nr:copper oxidase [FCB group bacterium]
MKHNSEESNSTAPLRVPRRRVLLAGLTAGAGSVLLSGAKALAARSSITAFNPPAARPPRPWSRWTGYPPGVPGRDYRPAFVPNGAKLPYKLVDGVKVFHLRAEEITHRIGGNLYARVWGYNGRMPGPVIEVVQGDKVRIFVTNKLPVKTSVHWHAIILPNGMDGVSVITQPAIEPGETGMYEFIFPDHGTFMYHPHFDNMTQEGMGLTGMIVVHPRRPDRPQPTRDFVLMLHEWFIEGGTARPNPFVMTDFNILTMNGKVFPDTYPCVAELGDRVWMRWGNLSPMDHHPIHLHGYAFKVIATDGGPIAESAQIPETTVLVHVGSTRTIEFYADNPGDWLCHCHMTHHTMNQMGHDIPNTIGVDTGDLDKRIRRLLPDYMTMGKTGMGDMADMKMPIPENSIPMYGVEGQFGQNVMGGMATLVKVREKTNGYKDPGWYEFPPKTVSRAATPEQLRAHDIDPDADLAQPDMNETFT